MSQRTDVLRGLTEAQREAVTHVDGPLLILAGPGSGKTRVVTHRIAYLLDQGVPASRILGLTFTNKAAHEMARRVERLRPGERVWLGTFHRWCALLLRHYAEYIGLDGGFTIYDTQDSLSALKRVARERNLSFGSTSEERVLREISRCKNLLISPDEYADPDPARHQANPLVWRVASEVYPAYQDYLKRSNAVDFDDLLYHMGRMLSESEQLRSDLDDRYRYILVDEYQDTNHAQYTLVRALSLDHPNLAATGDPDQSIYGWRGANLNNILNFEKDFGSVHVVRLEQNYRSTAPILRVADELIEKNVHRKRKTLFTTLEGGSPARLVCYADHQVEAEAIAERIAVEVRGGRSPADFAIFYRTNALSRSFELALRRRNLPYQVVNTVEFYQRKEVKDCLAYLQLLNNPRDNVSLLRIINTPARGIGKSTIDRLAAQAADEGISLLDTARRAGLVTGIGKRSAVKVAQFVAMYDKLRLSVHQPVADILSLVMELSGIREMYLGSDDPQDADRLANVDELLTAARDFDADHVGGDALPAFLEQALLINDTDKLDPDADRVTLMTLHAAKGLEFPSVFITCVEENILPHERSLRDDASLEEERRLLFVGITRAMRELQISFARRRSLRGVARTAIPSSFLLDLPLHDMQREGVDILESEAGHAASHAWDVYVDPDHVDDIDVEQMTAELDDLNSATLGDTGQRRGASKIQSDEAPRRTAGTSALITAAELLDGGATGAAGQIRANDKDLDRFCKDMMVIHPEYGLGRIVDVHGEGNQRAATIAFTLVPEPIELALVTSPLRVVRPGGR